jgi:hypothetical protein
MIRHVLAKLMVIGSTGLVLVSLLWQEREEGMENMDVTGAGMCNHAKAQLD